MPPKIESADEVREPREALEEPPAGENLAARLLARRKRDDQAP
jgi:hypothetical protein